MVQIHDIKPKTKLKPKKRIGRGGKRGAYSGKGQKGQKSRAGRKLRPQLRDVIKKIPKKRGYRFNVFRDTSVVLNIGDIENNFKEGSNINPQVIKKSGIIKAPKSKFLNIKILGGGNLTKKVNISGCAVSDSAKEKIKKAGGTVK